MGHRGVPPVLVETYTCHMPESCVILYGPWPLVEELEVWEPEAKLKGRILGKTYRSNELHFMGVRTVTVESQWFLVQRRLYS